MSKVEFAKSSIASLSAGQDPAVRAALATHQAVIVNVVADAQAAVRLEEKTAAGIEDEGLRRRIED